MVSPPNSKSCNGALKFCLIFPPACVSLRLVAHEIPKRSAGQALADALNQASHNKSFKAFSHSFCGNHGDPEKLA